MVPMLPAAPQPVTHDVTIVTTKKLARARVMGVPPEEFGIERNARSIRDCNYCFHEVVTKTQGDLIDEGFDPEQIKSISEYTGLSDLETLERDTEVEHMSITGTNSTNPSARIVKITEHYVRMDYEGNGRPCLYQVITGGDQGKVLRKRDADGDDYKDCITRFDEIPFAAACPVPQPHRFFGRSIADLVMEEQREKTALKRGLLDNMYMVLNPRIEVAESHAGVNTLDDILVARPNGVVRTKQPGGLNVLATPDITGAVYPALQYLDAVLESKTGISKQTQGLDANALQNQSATAVAQVFSASQMRIKMVARILAEGVRDMFSLLHGTIRKHGQEAQTVRLRNSWVNVDPRNWKTREDITINVGLGTGSKAQQFAQIMALANLQKELIQGGKGHMVGDDKLFNTASEMAKIMGYKNPDRFFDDPTAKDPQTGQLLHPPVQPPPDPKLQAVQVKAQADQAAAAQKGQLEQVKAMMDAYHQKVKTEGEITLAQIKADLDAKMAVLDAHIKAMGQHQQMRHAEQQHRMDMASSVMDMAATAHAHDTKMELAREAAKNKGNNQ